MKKKVIYGLLIAFFIICSFKLVSILKNKEYYTKLLDEKTNIYVYGISAPRGRILDCNGKVLVDNIGIKTIYYNKIKGIIKSKELEIAGLLANILSVDEATIDELKEYYLINNNDGKYLITDEEYKLFEERKKSLTYNDLKIDSPYNTYIQKGLPPTPIANPSIKSIKAVLEPSDTDYLYFVASIDGGNVYSMTYEEHKKYVEQYRKDRDKRNKELEEKSKKD